MIDPDVIWTYRATVVPAYGGTAAYDGDTYRLLIDQGLGGRHEENVRLLGVDTPEVNSSDPAEREAAQAARQFAVDWLERAVAEADTRWPLWIRTHKDRRSFTRYLAEVWDLQGRSLGDDLIAAGHGLPS